MYLQILWLNVGHFLRGVWWISVPAKRPDRTEVTWIVSRSELGVSSCERKKRWDCINRTLCLVEKTLVPVTEKLDVENMAVNKPVAHAQTKNTKMSGNSCNHFLCESVGLSARSTAERSEASACVCGCLCRYSSLAQGRMTLCIMCDPRLLIDFYFSVPKIFSVVDVFHFEVSQCPCRSHACDVRAAKTKWCAILRWFPSEAWKLKLQHFPNLRMNYSTTSLTINI